MSHTLVPTIATLFEVTTESGGTAAFDCAHGTPARTGQRSTMPFQEIRAEVAEHVRDLQPLPRQETRLSGG